MISRRIIRISSHFYRPNATAGSWARRTVPSRMTLVATRCFSAGHALHIKTVDMKETDLGALKVDQERLMDTLHHTCGFGTGLRWGRQAHRP